MASLSASEIKPFVGSRNFTESRDFYVALGCRINWNQGDLAELELGGYRFYLQRYYQREWCENSMLHITVEDADAWYRHVTAVLESRSYGAARVNPPKKESYGAFVTYVWDPVGVLVHTGGNGRLSPYGSMGDFRQYALVDQLDGTFVRTATGGTEFTITSPERGSEKAR